MVTEVKAGLPGGVCRLTGKEHRKLPGVMGMACPLSRCGGGGYTQAHSIRAGCAFPCAVRWVPTPDECGGSAGASLEAGRAL